MINKQCNAGDPLETLGGLYRGPPSKLMVMQNKLRACETVNQVQCSVTMKSSCYSSTLSVSSILSVVFGTSFKTGMTSRHVSSPTVTCEEIVKDSRFSMYFDTQLYLYMVFPAFNLRK